MKKVDNNNANSIPNKEAIQKAVTEDIAVFIYLTFLHSQGSAPFQSTLLSLAREEYKQYANDAYLEKEVGQKLLSKATSYVSKEDKHQQKDMNEIVGTCKREVTRFFDILRHPDDYLTGKELILNALGGIIERDLSYIDSGAKRTNKKDVHMSYLREYGLNGRPSGHRILDSMYLEISRQITEELENLHPKVREYLQTLITAWEKMHPGEKFLLDSLKSHIGTHPKE